MSEPIKLIEPNTHIFRSSFRKYITKALPVIPDKYGKKMPAIKAWSDYCYKLPTIEECQSWVNNLSESNIALCLGSASGIIALDIDADEQEILDIIMPLMPHSPVVKKGAKGETRFFRFTGETTDILKFNGKVVVEVLSNGKKSTLPPSLHPSGENYVWTSDKTLLDIDKNDLPILPPALFSHIASKLKLSIKETVNTSYNKIFNGRNDALSSLCGKLIGENVPVDDVIRELIVFDKDNNEIPLFTDPEENRHTEAYTNALNFYANHMTSINTRRYRESKEYEVPCIQTVADIEKLKEIKLGKSPKQEKLKNPSVELPLAQGVINNIYSTILSNSWVKQKELAFGASLALMATLCSRKVVFQGMSPNLYVLNIAPSGSGKDAPQQIIKNILLEINADHLLGAGDYVSDASLMNSLEHNPTRLDIMDEAGGILRSVNSGKSEYNGKMADVLAELYTTSNNKYLGRATAEGRKGACYRPNVNILASTTPTGFSEGVSLRAIEKGLMGRFLLFQGDPHQRAERLKTFPKIDTRTRSVLKHWFAFNPQDYNTATKNEISGIPQDYVELHADLKANSRLDEIFKEFDELRVNSDKGDAKLPIIARLYQQMIKIIILHACSRVNNDVPTINMDDVNFGYKTIKFYYATITDVIKKYIFSNNQEKDATTILNIMRDNDGEITKTNLSRKTRGMHKRHRDSIIDDLLDSEQIVRDVVNKSGKNQTIYYLVEEE